MTQSIIIYDSTKHENLHSLEYEVADPLTLAFVSSASAILGSLLTIILSPGLQHHFWKRQRRAEVRLAVINEINHLAAEYLNDLFFSYYRQEVPFKPSNVFFQSLAAVDAQVQILFSDATFRVFEKMKQEIPPHPSKQQQQAIQDFIQTRETALRALYKEIGLL